MPVKIDTQHAAQAARRSVTFCYICGEPLARRGSPGWRSQVRAEHIIPRCVMELLDPPEEERWPLILDVHPDCDIQRKAPRDQLAKIVSMTMPRQWSSAEVGLFKSQCEVKLLWVDGMGFQPVILGADDVLTGAKLWVRGFFAALYGEAMTWGVQHWIRPPTPAVPVESADPRAEIFEGIATTRAILTGIISARESGRIDIVKLFGGRIEFNSVWVSPIEGPSSLWLCLWALSLPNPEAVPREDSGQHFSPWHGAFSYAWKPRLAASISVITKN